MPRPKSLVLALLFIACFTLSTSCADKNECSRVSKELRKYPGPPISFSYSSDMKALHIGIDRCIVKDTLPDVSIWFTFYRKSLGKARTLKDALDLEVRQKVDLLNKDRATLVGDIEDVQRSIQGQMVHGKLLRISSFGEKYYFNEVYVLEKSDSLIFINLKAFPEDYALAECYFKIIADSIQ